MMEKLGRMDTTAAHVFHQELGDLTMVENGTAAARQKMAISSWESGWITDEIIQQSKVGSSNEGDLARARQVASAIRRGLHYETINHREAAIPRTYETTFEWIFKIPEKCNQEAQWSSFPTWLESESQDIYWITGKPGSGKSTLMKFITSKAMLKQHLFRWSGDTPLLLASFYFWHAGTEIQKSQEGLLRSLLSQCLDQMPSLGRRVCAKRWAIHEIFGPDIQLPSWEWSELAANFKSLTSNHSNDYKLALFIDGLDEFSGDHTKLVDFIKKISSRDGIKICVSSRPWNVFSDAYQRNPSLRLEVLTRKDIELFVKRRFKLQPGFLELSELFPHKANQLIETIVTKARGVFLWVSIVVEALVGGLADGDQWSALQATLNKLPEDIEDLFQSIWDSIDESHQGHALQFIQLHRTARGPLHAVKLWLADEENPLEFKIEQLQISKIINAIKRRLSSRTKGLLEISFHGHVEYIHRTVYDWIQKVWQNICSKIPIEYDAFLELLKAESCSILIANRLMESESPGNQVRPLKEQDWYWTHLQISFWYTMNVKDTPHNTPRLVKILDHLNSNLQTIMQRPETLRSARHHIIWRSIRCTCDHKTDFIGLAAQFAIGPYVRAKVSKIGKPSDTNAGEMSLLESAVFGWDCFPVDMIDELKGRENFVTKSRLELVEFLIKIGADTSQFCHTGSPISKAIKERYGEEDEFGEYANEVLKLLKAKPFSKPSKLFRRGRKY